VTPASFLIFVKKEFKKCLTVFYAKPSNKKFNKVILDNSIFLQCPGSVT